MSENTTTDHITEEELRLEKREKLVKENAAYKHTYDKTHSCKRVQEAYENIAHEDTITDSLKVAGRLIAKRGHGKAMFGNIMDDSGNLQVYFRLDALGEEMFSDVEAFDIGDIVGLEGTPFRTKRGELSLRITKATLLTKALLPLPEKYHGLQDKELRYRKRYLDLIANPDVKNTFKKRSDIIKDIRNYLNNDDFIEVETPVLNNIYGGASARPFTTHHNELKQDLYMRISLELPLKRLMVGGFEKVYEIGRVFRNEGVSYKHNPEYTLLELYQSYADYSDMMALTETLLSELAKQHVGSLTFEYQGNTIDMTPPFQRLTFHDALKTYADVNADDYEALFKKAEELGLEPNKGISKGTLIMDIYDKCVEPKLIQPTFMMDHPWETSPLAKRKRDNDDLVERFELIINGMEIANAFSELNDPIDQQERFEDQEKAREAGDDEAHLMDHDFIEALKYGMPPAGGLGIGIDRVVMLLTDSHSIRDVIFFPHMKDK
jgi:lysyl-tRNA synthetase class 2